MAFNRKGAMASTERFGDADPGSLPSIRTVLFDLDGTLIDSHELILSSYRHTMKVHLGWVPPDQAWLANMGKPLVTQLRGFASDEDETRAMLETYRRHNAQVHDLLVRPFPGIEATVRWLLVAGYRLGIVTSKGRDVSIRGLEACGLSPGWFEAIVTSDEPLPHKPDPGPVHLALDRMHENDARRTLFVGDSVWDLMAGRSAGTRTAAALWGPFGREELAAGDPDVWLERPGQVAELLQPQGPSAERRREF
jgi:pyrophosphatase PpaX